MAADVVLAVVWLAAVAYSVSQYRKNRDAERRLVAETEPALV